MESPACQFTRRLPASVLSQSVIVLSALAPMALSQPLSWSPQRHAQPLRSLAELAAEPTPQPGIAPSSQQAILIRNPDTSNGTPEYALADQYGQVQRYVESSPSTDLNAYVGERVVVRNDTGTTLLASQLQLPVLDGAAGHHVVLAQHQAPVATQNSNFIAPQRTAQVPPVVVGQNGVVTTTPVPNYPQYNTGQAAVPGTANYIQSYNAVPFANLDPSCGRGSRGRLYGGAEYLRWWFDDMRAPPLVTTSPMGTAEDDAGVLGMPDTSVLSGGGNILGGSRNGMRFHVGTWFNDYQDLALEGDAMFFENDTTSFSATGTAGDPILARPFFNMTPIVPPPVEDAILISFPAVSEGTVAVNARSEFNGAGIRLRAAAFCNQLGGVCNVNNPYGPATMPTTVTRGDVFGGYRYLELNERIRVTENRTDLVTADVTDLLDNFSTSNDFNGGDLGFFYEIETTRWTMSLLSKVALGNTRQRVSISGSTTINDIPVAPTTGFLAAATNVGTYERNVFTAIPEITATLGYKITPRIRATVGYNLLYWARVARPGDYIDLDIGAGRPQFAWNDTALLVHGLNVGLDGRF